MKTILSIQSHVAMGYVGNRAASFPLQRLGFEVIAVNTVELSNHTGYGEWTGRNLSPSEIASIISGVEARGGLEQCDAVLTGYLGDRETGQVILDAVAKVRRCNSRALFCCDPVMGDQGQGFFVQPGIPDFMRDAIAPAADILTPNQFELEFLSGGPIASLEQALLATAKVRNRNTKYVLLTSFSRIDASPATIEMLLDSPDGAWLVSTPKVLLSPPPNGAGDCVTALFLAHFLKTRAPAQALGYAASAIYAVFQATARAGTRELQIIAAQDELSCPSKTFHVERVQ
ncbi:Pyridoxal kinase PdxY [Azospirillaceae bacterium]